jgi:hypothetical protein
VVRHLGASLCRPDRGPALLDTVGGMRIDLVTGARTAVDGLAGAATSWAPIAASPDGTRWLRASRDRPVRWAMHGAGEAHACVGGSGQAIGVDPGGRAAWGGGRCYFYWRILGDRGPALWTPSSHDWPCGHGKKLYGHENNDPLFVHLAADAAACLSVYEHDALVTPGVPLRWRDVGGFAVAERARGEPRALLFEYTDTAGPAADPYAADEDARHRRPVVTLGPSAELRYVVGLEAPVYRLACDVVHLLGGPAAGWIGFDDQHREVRRGTGRLLAGWDRWAVIEQQGRLRREDLVDGSQQDLGVVDHPVFAAAAVAGSPNAVLFSRDDGGLVRLV